MKMNHEEDYVGVIDMYDKTKTFGFLVSSIVERSTGRSKIQSFYFNYLCWDDATTYPTEGHYVVFVGCESRNGFRAKKVLPVSFKKEIMETALRQAENSSIIKGRPSKSHKNYSENVILIAFKKNYYTDADKILACSAVCDYLNCKNDDASRRKACMAWFADSRVKKLFRELFQDVRLDEKYKTVIEVIRSVLNNDRGISDKQNDFYEFMGLDEGDKRLVVKIEGNTRGWVVKEIRGPDFSKIDKYKIVPRNAESGPEEKGCQIGRAHV